MEKWSDDAFECDACGKKKPGAEMRRLALKTDCCVRVVPVCRTCRDEIRKKAGPGGGSDERRERESIRTDGARHAPKGVRHA